MKRNGRTSAGKVRWRCKDSACGVSKTRRSDSSAAGLGRFLGWLFSKDNQAQAHKGSARSFRYQTAQFWDYWALPHFQDVYSPVVHVDGLHLRRQAVVLIAATPQMKPLAWYLARSEHAAAWEALLAQVSAPLMVVTDGGSGLRKAVNHVWPGVRIQRCLFHVYLNITAKTSKNPRLLAGKELKSLAWQLLHIDSLEASYQWEANYLGWEAKWESFLNQKSRYKSGQWADTHEKLVSARNMIRSLLRQGQLFTYLEPGLVQTVGGPLPSTNNTLEGGINAALREMLKTHRGMLLLHRVKAVFWWCYQHSPDPISSARALKEMPTDTTIADLYQQARQPTTTTQNGAPIQWGTTISWEDLHHKTWKK